jgi:hypothetical protein
VSHLQLFLGGDLDRTVHPVLDDFSGKYGWAWSETEVTATDRPTLIRHVDAEGRTSVCAINESLRTRYETLPGDLPVQPRYHEMLERNFGLPGETLHPPDGI